MLLNPSGVLKVIHRLREPRDVKGSLLEQDLLSSFPKFGLCGLGLAWVSVAVCPGEVLTLASYKVAKSSPRPLLTTVFACCSPAGRIRRLVPVEYVRTLPVKILKLKMFSIFLLTKMPRLLTFVINIQHTLGSHFVHGIYQLYHTSCSHCVLLFPCKRSWVFPTSFSLRLPLKCLVVPMFSCTKSISYSSLLNPYVLCLQGFPSFSNKGPKLTQRLSLRIYKAYYHPVTLS